MNKEIKEAVELGFNSNPKVEVLHVTRDGQCFEEWHNANEHSKTLGNNEADRKVEEVKRTDIITEKKAK